MRTLAGPLLAVALPLLAQNPCGNTPVMTPCEVRREVPNAGPNLELWAEFRSPEYKTYRLPAFWDGGKHMVFRVTPVIAGTWTYRLTGTPEVEGKLEQFTAVENPSAVNFIRKANAHHWQSTEGLKPHLYVGAEDQAGVALETWAKAGITHLTVRAGTDLKALDARIAAIHAQGLVTDLVIPAPKRAQMREMVARYSAFNITWQLGDPWESVPGSRAPLKEAGAELKRLDPYNHPRSARALGSSSALGADGWEDYFMYGTGEQTLVAVEHQMYLAPQVSVIDGRLPPGVFRKKLWNATMSGAYPVMSGPAAPDSPNGRTLSGWAVFMAERVRHWDIEPYFDLDGGRAVAIPGIQNDDYDIPATEYLVYVETPGKISVKTRRHSYDVYWVNPDTGEATKDKKDWKGDLWEGTPPDATRDWILHLSRDGRKEGMLRSYKFESWPMPVQEPEQDQKKQPFELVAPALNTTLDAGRPVAFQIKLKRQTGGTRRMTYVLLGEVVRDGQGTRLLADSPEGTFTVPAELLTSAEGTLNVRLAVLNAPGKLYLFDTVFTIRKPQ